MAIVCSQLSTAVYPKNGMVLKLGYYNSILVAHTNKQTNGGVVPKVILAQMNGGVELISSFDDVT